MINDEVVYMMQKKTLKVTFKFILFTANKFLKL